MGPFAQRFIFILSLFFTAMLLSAGAPASTHAQAYENEDIAQEARRFENYLLKEWSAAGDTAAGWRRKAQGALKKGDARSAAGYYASALVLDKDNAATWLALARAYLAIVPKDFSERNNFSRNASSAAYLAYRRSATKPEQAAALAVLARSLTARAWWRPALEAYRASLELQESKWVRAAYEQVRAEHGFRMLDYTVDSESSSPRLCIQFSERLAKGVDFSKFVSVNGGDPAGVKAEDQQICIEELLHGRRYEVRLRQGLPSAVDEALLKPVDLTVYVRDRKPSVRFTGRNYVLPRTGQQGLPLVSVNTEKVELEIYRIGDRRLAHEVLEGEFGDQLPGYRVEEIREKHGELLWKGEMSVKMALNEEVTTAFPVDEIESELKPGLYVITARPAGEHAEEWQERATQWFVVSDLGLTAFSGRDGVHVFVRSLESARALSGIEVRLIARSNEVLSKATTDSEGRATFPFGLTRGEGGLAPALVVARTEEGDYGFLDLTKSAFDLTDRGVAGRAAPGPLDAMLFTERGVYRPGEEVFVTALLRDDQANAVADVPLTLIFRRPDGVEHRRVVLPDQGAGGRAYTLGLLPQAMSGTWRVSAHVDPEAPAIGETAFLVEDYVPERLEMTVAAGKEPLAAARPARITIAGRYLYGAPANDLALEGELNLSSTRSLEAFQGYLFGLADEQVTSVRQPLSGLPRTASDGKAQIDVALPQLPETTRPLVANVTIRLREPGGRAIAETISLAVNKPEPVIGIKPLFAGSHVPEGELARFEVIGVDGSGQRTALGNVNWELVRLETRFQWYSRNGRWDYEPVTYTERVANGTISLDKDTPARIKAPVAYGRYRLEIASADPSGPAASVLFTGGWFVAETPDTPDILDIALDKPAYLPGETMTVQIRPRMAGRALVAVISDRILATKSLPVSKDGATVSFTVAEDWGPGTYVAALMYRPMSAEAKRMPSRALGVKWLKLDPAPHKLKLSLDAPARARPRQTLSLPVRVAGLEAGEKARVVVAAVDKGILNLTSYTPPAPEDHFLGQRRLGMEIRDLYGHLIDGMQGVRGQIRTGGDLAAGGLQMQGRPRSIKPVALYSGIVEVGPDESADVAFELPAFDGTLRVMAIAWSPTKLGHAVSDIVVRDPVVMLATPPQFLTIGDSSQLHLSLQNVEGPAGDYLLMAEAHGGLMLPKEVASQKLALTADERIGVVLPLKAQALGDARIRVALEGPGGLSIERTYEVPILPAAPNVTRRTVQTLAAKSGTLNVTRDLIADLIPETVKVAVNVGRSAAIDIAGLLLSLDRYPYGCAEQITSRALPLLYLSQVAESAGLAGEDGAKARIEKAIERLTSLQDAGGNFGLWAPGGYDVWLTAYVTDFLIRASERGYAVRSEVLTAALDRLKNAVSYAPDFTSGGEDLAYALYVLARAGRAVIGDLRYYADTKLANFATPLAQAQIGAALALYGDKERAERAFTAAMARLQASPLEFARRTDYGTALRDGAGTLTLIAETRTMTSAIPRLTDLMQTWRAHQTGTTTQENAWLLLAAQALIEESQDMIFQVNGTEQRGPVQKVLTADNLAAEPFTLRNISGVETSVSVIVSGASATPEPAAASGLQIERKVYTLQGKEVSLDKVSQNDRFVVVLKVREDEAKLGHLVVEDRLPAGFQIENPRLLDSTDLAAFSWLQSKSEARPVHTAFRDDRFIAAFSLTSPTRKTAATFTIAYVMRAVVPGSYVYGGAKVEDMYRPDRFARSAPGLAQIVRLER